MKVTQNDLIRFAFLSSNSEYNEERKLEYRNLGRKLLKKIVELMGLQKGEYDISWNPGGIACSGDHMLHTDKVYLALHDNLGSGWFYWRSCVGRRDFSGGTNQIYNWNTLTIYGLELLADTLKKVQNS